MNKEQEKIYNGLMSKYNFNELQKEQIILGLELGFDVSIYAKPEYNCIFFLVLYSLFFTF